MERSYGQAQQDRNRDSRGKFKSTFPCEACGKPAPHNYYSLSTSGDGVGVVLCGRARCPSTTLAEPNLRQIIIARRGW